MTKITDRKIRTNYQPSAPANPNNSRQERRARNAARWFTTLIAAAAVLEQQADDWAEGFPPASGGQPGGTGSISRPVEAAVITPYRQNPDGTDDDTGPVWQQREGQHLADQCAAAVAELDDWLRQGSRLNAKVLRLLPQQHHVAEMLARHADARFNGAGECKACGEWVEGVDADQDTGHRLRRGLCPACYKRWERAGRPDLVTWIADQRHRNGLCQQRECLHDHGDDKDAGVREETA